MFPQDPLLSFKNPEEVPASLENIFWGLLSVRSASCVVRKKTVCA